MRVLLTGASGQLGAYLVPHILDWGWDLVALGGPSGPSPLDLAVESSIASTLEFHDPAVVLHAAAISSAEAVLGDPSRAHAVNVRATRAIADWCRHRSRRLVYISTDMVFDGTRPFWREADPTGPTLAYGRSKLEAEPFVMATAGGLVARLGLMYGRSKCGRPSFYDRAVEDLRAGRPRAYFEDEYRTPLPYAVAATYLTALIEAGAEGLVHVAGQKRMSRYALMRQVAQALQLDASSLRANRQADAPAAEPRPADVSLDTSRLGAMLS